MHMVVRWHRWGERRRTVDRCRRDLGYADRGHDAVVSGRRRHWYLLRHCGVRGENGDTLTNADLDACYGHTHAMTRDGATVTLYHYHATYEFPYTVGCYNGTPISM
jgi:hypothetical protein